MFDWIVRYCLRMCVGELIGSIFIGLKLNGYLDVVECGLIWVYFLLF